MSQELTARQIRQLKEERSLDAWQVGFIQRMIREYGQSVSKEEIIGTYRKYGYVSTALEDELKERFGKHKRDYPVLITYDLHEDGMVSNFEVERAPES